MKKNYLALKYVQDFRCTGSECPETCCGTEWHIVLDKKSTKSYLNSPNDKVRAIAKKTIEVLDGGNKETYAKAIALDKEKGVCGFCIDGLCLIHAKMGEKGLCRTCYFYPKIINEINGQRELTIVLSCPDAAKIALLDERAMEFIEIERDLIEDKVNIQCSITLEDYFKTPKAEEVFWGIRGFVVRLMSDRRYSIDDRMIILGLFHQKLAANLKQDKYIEVLELIEEYQGMLNSDKLLDFTDIEIKYDLQLTLMNSLISMRESINTTKQYKGYQDVLKNSKEALELEDSTVDIEYEKATLEYSKHLKMIEPILENYIINYLIQHVYPFSIHNIDSDVSNYEESYMVLMVHLLTLKLILIGNCYYYKDKLQPEHIIKVIYSNTKVTTHNQGYLKGIIQELKNDEIYSLAWMIAIFKTVK